MGHLAVAHYGLLTVCVPSAAAFAGASTTFQPKDAEVKATESTSGRRAALAKWITGDENPLFARSAANRIWQQLFGKGLVASSGDLGLTGTPPTHPELLDYLALDFRKNGYSVKKMIELIVTSETYRQSSRADDGMKIDPENALLWRSPRKRLDGESLRDALLSVSGELNLKAGGPSVMPELPAELKSAAKDWKVSADTADRNRRSIYVLVKRNLRYPLFALFDSPERVESCSRRFTTTTAPQALNLLNDSLVLNFAKGLAGRVEKVARGDPDKSITAAMELALNRLPTSEERTAMKGFLGKHKGTPTEALIDLCHALLNLNEFLYID